MSSPSLWVPLPVVSAESSSEDSGSMGYLTGSKFRYSLLSTIRVTCTCPPGSPSSSADPESRGDFSSGCLLGSHFRPRYFFLDLLFCCCGGGLLLIAAAACCCTATGAVVGRVGVEDATAPAWVGPCCAASSFLHGSSFRFMSEVHVLLMCP
jgi:hypothetical protein